MVTSTAVIADVAREVGGDRVAVRSLVAPLADVHTFTLSPGDAIAIADADLVILNGAGLEAAFQDVIEENMDGELLVLSQALDVRSVGNDGSAAQNPTNHALDPHLWLDPRLMIDATAVIGEALGALDPAGATAYTRRAAGYSARLEALDSEVRNLFQGLPAERRVLVTFHDAYGRFAARYGLEILGFVVESPEEHANAAAVADLIEEMRERGVAFIFREPQFTAPIVEEIASETGAMVRDIFSTIDAAAAPTYIDLMRANAHAIAD